MLSAVGVYAALLALVATTLFGFTSSEPVGSKDLFRCRQRCYQKFVHDWHHCMDFEDCKSMCITPPNINSYIPEAFSFLCWNNCDQQLGPFPLNINSALRQGSLVLTDIAWDQAITNASKQCLVTWEVSGGGLMGNLLTDSSTVELSLWPDTVYHIQVTCKHKETGGMRRSFKLIVDTHKLSDSTATGMQAIAMDTGMKSLPNHYATEPSPSSDSDSRMRILKDSSKDFLSPYNPNAIEEASEKSASPSSTAQQSLPASTAAPPAAESPSVLRTKLAMGAPSDFLTQSAVFATVGSLVLLAGLLVLYLLSRPSPSKAVPAGASAIDKEVLIRRELLPSQTHAPLTSVTTSPASASATATAPDGQALHV